MESYVVKIPDTGRVDNIPWRPSGLSACRHEDILSISKIRELPQLLVDGKII